MKPNFTKADIHRSMMVKKQRITDAIISRLEYVGWGFVKMAREKTAASGGFNDVTGNLRSSIGFTVLHNGQTKLENFEASKSGTDKVKGMNEAKKYIRELKANFTEGYVLIVVAGMGYAAAVESRGKDVITGSSLVAERMLKQALKRLKEKL